MIDLRQSPYWAMFMEELGWTVEKVGSKDKEQFVYLRKVPWLGNILKAPRLNTPLPLKELDQLSKERKVAFVKVEPNILRSEREIIGQIEEDLYKTEKWSLSPTKTIVMDLRKSEEELLNSMEKDTRYSIKAAQRRGVRVIKTSDLERFLKLYRQTAKRKKFWIAEKELKVLWDIFSNEGKGFILIAQWNKTDIAGCLILHYDKKAYYYHAASLNKMRELFAPYLLVWETILNAKALKLRELDLEGVYDPRIPSTKNWQGFTHFKKGFRGDEVEFAGSFVKTYTPLAKVIFKFGNFSF